MTWDICPAATKITQEWGCTDYVGEWVAPDCPGGHYHAGIDLGTDPGSTVFRQPVVATRPGRVVQVGLPYLGPYAVCWETDDAFIELGHLDEAHVAVGDLVKVGDVLGLAGSQGASSGPHLHVEVRADGPFQSAPSSAILDPAPYLNYLPSPPLPLSIVKFMQEQDEMPTVRLDAVNREATFAGLFSGKPGPYPARDVFVAVCGDTAQGTSAASVELFYVRPDGSSVGDRIDLSGSMQVTKQAPVDLGELHVEAHLISGGPAFVRAYSEPKP